MIISIAMETNKGVYITARNFEENGVDLHVYINLPTGSCLLAALEDLYNADGN